MRTDGRDARCKKNDEKQLGADESKKLPRREKRERQKLDADRLEDGKVYFTGCFCVEHWKEVTEKVQRHL